MFATSCRILLWLRVVQPILPALELRTGVKELPRIWWCPTGPLTFLPIHAAGLYDIKEQGHKITDFAVSSYIPTVGALFKGSHSAPPEALKLLTIAQPYGHSALPGTLDEVGRIKARAKNASMTSLVDSQATVEEVLRGMKESHWVHFACHGVQDSRSPTDSCLILADEARLKLSDIINLALPHSELAFLSACQTATGYELLSEEAIHLSGGMLLAGYQGVVATTWSIMDREAPQVAEDFYERLFGEKKERADHRRAAHALHYAVERLRNSKDGRSFLSWVPFIHMGV
ncbi:CHAT domain-containing protein [Mycena galericulata]|nr:CHAT domain-containing protein [Mycena galericulata]